MSAKALSRREFLILSRTLVGATLLVACVPQTAQPAATTSDGDAAAPGAEPVTIRYGRHDPGSGTEITIDTFQQEHPDITVEMEQIMEFPAKIPALAAAGTLPDVVRSWEAMLFEMAHAGQFIDLQPFVDLEPEFNPEDFYEAHWNYPVIDGKRYAISDVVATHVTYYNIGNYSGFAREGEV